MSPTTKKPSKLRKGFAARQWATKRWRISLTWWLKAQNAGVQQSTGKEPLHEHNTQDFCYARCVVPSMRVCVQTRHQRQR